MTGSIASTSLRWSGGVVIAVVAVTRCVVFFAPHLVFDVDPLVDAAPLNGFGPARSLCLDVILLVACAAALLGETLAGRKLEWPLLIAAAIPVPIVLWHGAGDAGDLWRGATWIGAIMAGVTIAHLARDRALRTVLAAMLLAVLGPLLVRGAANITYEYEDSVTTFETHKQEILAGNGWEDGSPQARIFERRLRHRQPTGWFVTTNIYASLMAFGCVAAVGLAIAATRAGLAGGWAGLMVLLAAGTGAAVWATGSKGAMLVSAAGLGLVVAPFVHTRISAFLRRFGKIIAVVAVLGALGGVLVRGVVLPESFAGDRSLLFRWHYTVSSARILAAHPAVGVGPDGYQVAYVANRVPRNPEEVASAHSVFWDWMTSLGVAGAAWVALAFVLLWRAGGALARADGQSGEPFRLSPRGMTLIVIAGLAGLAIGVRAEIGGVDAFVGLVRGLGMLAGLGLGFAFAYLVTRGDRGIVAWALAAAAIVLTLHAQIEMTLTQPGAAVWCLGVIGLSGWRREDDVARRGGTPALGVAAASALAVCAVWLAATGAVPALRAQRHMIGAAAFIGASADDTRPGAEMNARLKAERSFAQANSAMPSDPHPLVVAAEQFERAAALAPAEDRVVILRQAIEFADRALANGAGGRARAVAIRVHRRLSQLSGDTGELSIAVDIARQMVDADPHGLGARRRLADLLWEAGRRDEARVEYARTLEINEAFSLDPLKQLPDRERAAIEGRIR